VSAAYAEALFEKLSKEATELKGAAPGQVVEELADLWEVLHALARALDVEPDEIEAAAREKREARGGFAGRVWLKRVSPAAAD
jgi:predicted house-cleaning noncanonical NTP pyrophosphatase (MazG superfamily)